MALPPSVRVKLSSEAAGAISITPVVVRDMAIRELVECILAVTGKDETRIHEVIYYGNFLSGASRFRWTGWDASPEDLREMLATFPDADPARPFSAADCFRVILRGGRQPIEIARDAATRKAMFQREAFWDALMQGVSGGSLSYSGYSYRDRADRYLHEFTFEEIGQLRAASPLIRYTSLSEQVRTQGFTQAELFVKRETA
jgi:hypothetical protein